MSVIPTPQGVSQKNGVSGSAAYDAAADPLAETRAYYDEFSHGYERHRLPNDPRGYHALIDDLEVRLVERYGRDRDVLECGSGTGLLLSRFAQFARSAKGIDLSPGMLAHAKERGLDVREGSVTSLPFEDASFDVTCSFKVLAHVPNIALALSEMARVTRPGGVVLAEFYNPLSFRGLLKRFGRWKDLRPPQGRRGLHALRSPLGDRARGAGHGATGVGLRCAHPHAGGGRDEDPRGPIDPARRGAQARGHTAVVLRGVLRGRPPSRRCVERLSTTPSPRTGPARGEGHSKCSTAPGAITAPTSNVEHKRTVGCSRTSPRAVRASSSLGTTYYTDLTCRLPTACSAS